MRLKPWAKMPTGWIQSGGLLNFQWKEGGSAGTAALMLYFTLCQYASQRPLRPSETREPEPNQPPLISVPSPSASIAPLEPISVPPWLGIPSRPAAEQGIASPAEPWQKNTSVQDGVNPAGAQKLESGMVVTPNTSILAIPAPPQGLAVKFGSGVEIVDSLEHGVPDSLVTRLTYDEFSGLTGLSRERINAGLRKLIAEKMIWRVDGSRSYGLTGFGPRKRWVKLPGGALLSPAGTQFLPYSHLTLRSKHELNALKLHFYYAHTRESEQAYSEVSYPTILRKTGVPERDIPKANSLLLSYGILQRTRGLPSEDAAQHESNKYYLTGYQSFFIKKAA